MCVQAKIDIIKTQRQRYAGYRLKSRVVFGVYILESIFVLGLEIVTRKFWLRLAQQQACKVVTQKDGQVMYDMYSPGSSRVRPNDSIIEPSSC